MLYSLKVFEDTPVFIDEGAYSMGEGGDNYSFLDIIMGFSASCVFRKLHGNNFTVKCSIIMALTLSPPRPTQSDVPAKQVTRKAVNFES